MSALISVPRQTISQIECGDDSLSATPALKLAKIRGVAAKDMFYQENNPHEEYYQRTIGRFSQNTFWCF